MTRIYGVEITTLQESWELEAQEYHDEHGYFGDLAENAHLVAWAANYSYEVTNILRNATGSDEFEPLDVQALLVEEHGDLADIINGAIAFTEDHRD